MKRAAHGANNTILVMTKSCLGWSILSSSWLPRPSCSSNPDPRHRWVLWVTCPHAIFGNNARDSKNCRFRPCIGISFHMQYTCREAPQCGSCGKFQVKRIEVEIVVELRMILRTRLLWTRYETLCRKLLLQVSQTNGLSPLWIRS